MNDQLTAHLTDDYHIPEYVQGRLFVRTDSGIYRCDGARGLFTLDTPADWLTLCFGKEDDAPVLAHLHWQVDSLAWDGAVRIGGYIDVQHIMGDEALPAPLVVLHVGGQPLLPSVNPLRPPLSFDDALADTDWTTAAWLAFDDHPALTLAQDALVSKLRVWCFGALADDDSGLHELIDLPILLESMTLFAP